MIVLDVSNNNGALDLRRMRSHLAGLYAKASEGHSFTDGTYHGFRAEAKLLGLPFGAYHFARPDVNDPTTEAAHFLGVIGHKFDMLPALDLEHGGHVGASDPVAWARDFNAHVHAALGVYPLFYSFTAFVKGLGARKPIGSGLWLADSGQDDGTRHPAKAPAPWKTIRLHQFTSRGHLPGTALPVDLSYCEHLPLVRPQT